MKPYLPYNILLALAVAAGGMTILYNLVFRENTITTLEYAYPVIEQPARQPERVLEPERVYPAQDVQGAAEDGIPGDPSWIPFEEEPEEDGPITSVRFPLDINTATVEQLKFIPQVGDVMAQRIVQYRDHLGGRYTDLEQLKGISGIGDKTYERLWAYFTIGEEIGSGGEAAFEEDGITYVEVPE